MCDSSLQECALAVFKMYNFLILLINNNNKNINFVNRVSSTKLAHSCSINYCFIIYYSSSSIIYEYSFTIGLVVVGYRVFRFVIYCVEQFIS